MVLDGTCTVAVLCAYRKSVDGVRCIHVLCDASFDGRKAPMKMKEHVFDGRSLDSGQV